MHGVQLDLNKLTNSDYYLTSALSKRQSTKQARHSLTELYSFSKIIIVT